MIVRRVVETIIAAAVMAASAGVVVVALAFALYTLLRDYLGPSGAGAVIAAGFAVLLAIAGLVLMRVGGARKKAPPPRETSFAGRVVETLRERPIVAAGAAAAAGLIAWRNPELVASILRAFEPRQERD